MHDRIKSLKSKVTTWLNKPMKEHRCDICGMIYMFGLDIHEPCRKVERRRHTSGRGTGPK